MSSVSTRFDPCVKPPSSLFIEITHECNLHCKMCHLWRTREDKSRSISADQKVEAIRQFKKINACGSVVFTGGETIRKTAEFLRLSKLCNELGLTSSANTNGTLITPDLVRRLVEYGPKYLVVSLDSIHREIHDHLRGANGTYDAAVNAIRLFSEEKRNHDHPATGIYTNCIVMEQNYRELEQYVSLAKSIGADGVMFQMLSRTFGLAGDSDYAFDNYLPKDKDAFKAQIASFTQNHAGDDFIKTSPMGFRYMISYVDNPDFISPEVCASGENNLMIDTYGNTQLCFNMYRLTGGFLGNVRDKALSEMWTSAGAEEARTIMSRCRKSCGVLNCHRRK